MSPAFDQFVPMRIFLGLAAKDPKMMHRKKIESQKLTKYKILFLISFI
jgi:hypothetical protein